MRTKLCKKCGKYYFIMTEPNETCPHCGHDPRDDFGGLPPWFTDILGGQSGAA